MPEERTYTQAEIREIVGLLMSHDWVSEDIAKDSSSTAVKELFIKHMAGDLRHWGAFAEIVAFAYDPKTQSISTAVRSTSFLGDPRSGMHAALKEAGWDGTGSMEMWGLRHRWSRVSERRRPECLESLGERPKQPDALGKLVKAAWALTQKNDPEPYTGPAPGL